MESTRRTLCKAVLWQVMGFVSMSLVGLAMTGSVITGGAIAVLNTAIGFVCYVVYERAWSRVRWGREA